MTSYGCHPFSRAGLSLHLRPQRRVQVASELDFELLTIDGSGGGTGMSPNDMLDNWGVPSVLLHAKAHDYAFLRAAAGKKVVDLAVGGGLAKPSQAFKALALGAPYVKAVCMSRSFMIPAFLGYNIEGALHPERRERVHGAWSALPKTVLDIGDTPETIFAGYHALKERLGADEMAHIPYGAIACGRCATGSARGSSTTWPGPASSASSTSTARTSAPPTAKRLRKRASPSSRNKTTSWRAASCSADKERRSCWICS